MINGEGALWRAFILLKIDKIAKSLRWTSEHSNAHVPALFRDYVSRFLDYIQGNLAKPVPADKLRNLHRALDELARYLRFYDSALIHRAPYPLLDHVQRQFEQIERDSVVLLRPQNSYDFETRSERSAIRDRLRSITTSFAPKSWRPNRFLDDLRHLKNIHIVSYPRQLDDVFLFYPLIGHELGHVLRGTRQLDSQLRTSRFGVKGSVSLSVIALAQSWAIELYCDRVGMHFFGESYLYALWLFLKRDPETFDSALISRAAGAPKVTVGDLDRRIRHALRGRSHTRPDAAVRRLVETLRPLLTRVAVQPADRPRDDPGPTGALSHPSLGRRLRYLAERLDPRPPRLHRARTFVAWRAQFLREGLRYNEKYTERGHQQAIRLAVSFADTLYASLKPHIPPSFERDDRELADLIQRIERRIPPCERRLRSGVLLPATWETAIEAGWVQFIETTLSKDKQRAEIDLEWMNFIYQSLDMISLSRSFLAARELVPKRKDQS